MDRITTINLIGMTFCIGICFAMCTAAIIGRLGDIATILQQILEKMP